MSYVGYYINLDRSLERRTEIEAQLVRYGLSHRYQRFPATDGNGLAFPNPYLTDGQIGCFTSHCLVLDANLHSRFYLHIIEDDVVFSKYTHSVINNVLSRGFAEFDIIFTDLYLAPSIPEYKTFKAQYDNCVARDQTGRVTQINSFGVVGLKNSFFAGMTSYLVNPRSINKLRSIYMEALTNGARKPIDLVIRDSVRGGAIRAGLIFPFVTSIRLERLVATTTQTTRDPRSDTAANLARLSFFVESNISELRQYAEEVLTLPVGDSHHQLLSRILSFVITEMYHTF
jgi:GR25 family glycosyltransferase involved in LPS biosynthesis